MLAGGCFWGVQGVYQHVKGVTSAISGYAGGQRNTAQYQIVGRGDSGHAEVWNRSRSIREQSATVRAPQISSLFHTIRQNSIGRAPILVSITARRYSPSTPNRRGLRVPTLIS